MLLLFAGTVLSLSRSVPGGSFRGFQAWVRANGRPIQRHKRLKKSVRAEDSLKGLLRGLHARILAGVS
jgi:hypothetical protein